MAPQGPEHLYPGPGVFIQALSTTAELGTHRVITEEVTSSEIRKSILKPKAYTRTYILKPKVYTRKSILKPKAYTQTMNVLLVCAAPGPLVSVR